jgi:hypothetical protein
VTWRHSRLCLVRRTNLAQPIAPAHLPSGRSFLFAFTGAAVSPVVLRSGPYLIYFYSHEPNEPPHVHVDRDDLSAKFWLEPVGLAYNLGFSAHELRRIERIIHENQPQLREGWRGIHGT